jgi:hypothetical protein
MQIKDNCLEEIEDNVDEYPGSRVYEQLSSVIWRRCAMCDIGFDPGDPLDYCILMQPIYTEGVDIYDCYWPRAEMHVKCAALYQTDTSVGLRWTGRETHPIKTCARVQLSHLWTGDRSIEASIQALLLLETLGLPRDVAWAIAGAAYWLL